MRDKLGGFHQRGCGAVDPRISNLARAQSEAAIPLTVGTPLLWYVGDDIAMTTDSAVVNSFTDRMGVAWGLPASCIGLLGQPRAINGHNALLSGDYEVTSSANRIMSSASITTAADVTVFLVFRPYSRPCAFPVLLQKGTVNAEWLILQDTTNFTWRYKLANNADFTTSVVAGKHYIIAGRGSTATADLYLNGTIQGTAKVPTAPLGSVSSAVYMGGNGPSPTSNYTNAQFAELIVYNSYLSDANRNAVEKYLGRKYGVVVA